ncbi:MAG: class I SAM-dependent methyltransferase [Methanobacterium sp.]|jgi:ubiquinone/menaquinone biosynthesis C-methylase UbiE|uniref:class I SAM-dependent methyltransferase n=1 Tax=Methanobacterium sp. TaxID=2164 RepID=UPI0025843E98|nr:class I SAM-dependent methyltransferase [Methanobacterium sp.]MCC7560985.1 class I SAM-dependent methyltransferase [Methanobacterium sp.]
MEKLEIEGPQSIDSMLINGPHALTYHLISNQITRKMNVKDGIAIDVGAGPASLSIAMARITGLKIYAMDIHPEILRIAQESIKKQMLGNRINPMLGDVHQMPFPDDFADLIFSRGSMFFWKDLTTAFQEIYRVLKPGGSGYIGGGFGSTSVKEKIKKQLKHDSNRSYKSPPKIHIDTFEIAILNAGIRDYTLINDDTGLWALFVKQTN